MSIIEAAPGLLPRLPDRIGASVARELERIGVRVRVGTTVSAVEDAAVVTRDGERIRADISVWAAGVRAPEWLSRCGFPTDRLGRIEVEDQTQGMRYDESQLVPVPALGLRAEVYPLGDCCLSVDADGTEVPPRAQAAHQMASIAARNLVAGFRERTLKPFVYQDFGSLVSLSKFSTVGNLMGNLMRGTVFIEGWMARMAYLSLYRMHQRAVHGTFTTLLIMIGDRIYRATRAEIKLH